MGSRARLSGTLPGGEWGSSRYRVMDGVLGKAVSGEVCHSSMLCSTWVVRRLSMNSSSISSNIRSRATDWARMMTRARAATHRAMRRRMLGAWRSAASSSAE